MRPRGSFGEVAQALCRAAEVAPGTVRELAARACVGYDVARYTASRLVSSGALAPARDGRPVVLTAPAAPPGDGVHDALQQLHRSFWERDSANAAT